MSVAARIEEKLVRAFRPVRLAIENESDKHAGHEGVREGNFVPGESHFRVLIVSDVFRGRSRLDRHRLVNEALAEEMRSIHALAIRAITPEEAAG